MDYECKITRFAEFDDQKLEKEFTDREFKKSSTYLKTIILIYGILHFLFLALDIAFLHSEYDIITHSLIPRTAVLIVAIIVWALANKLSNEVFMNLASISTVLFYIEHAYIVSKLEDTSIIAPAFTVVIVILILFVIPNRWILNMIYAGIVTILFAITAPLLVNGINISTITVLLMYYYMIISLVGLLLLRFNSHKRLQYFREIQLESLAKTDPLTKSHNRLASNNIIMKLCNEKARFSLIIFDLDDFKSINDMYGHVYGDEVLVGVTQATSKSIRKSDMLIRWGGEEFLVILYDTSLDIATELAERIRKNIESINFDRMTDKVTASFGVTEYVKDDTIHSIIDRADQRLYEAKEHGKNKVEFGK